MEIRIPMSVIKRVKKSPRLGCMIPRLGVIRVVSDARGKRCLEIKIPDAPEPEESDQGPKITLDRISVDEALANQVQVERDTLWQAATGARAPRAVTVNMQPEGMPVGKMSKPAHPWRLPTLEECQGDPAAAAVWNIVYKPELKWNRTAEVGPPTVVGKVDSPEWLASLNRHVWAACEGGRVAWLSTAAAIRTSYSCRQKVPDYWMEADTPKPPQ